MDIEEVRATATAVGLQRVLKDIEQLVRPSIRLSPTLVDDTTLKVGSSKIGGMPDLPSDIKWPVLKDLPQSFIAQIRLDEVHPYDTNKVLPSQGILWFFYDARQSTFGTSSADRAGWQVIFADSSSQLKRASPSSKLPPTSQFRACSLNFAGEITLPQQPQLDLAQFDWTDEEQQKYETLLSTLHSKDQTTVHHRMLGYPDTLQDDMRLQCQLASNGVTGTDDPRIAELSKGALDWQLLLQVDTDERIAMRWASSGMLYYWIKKDDLHSQCFEKCWFVLQSE